MHGATQGPIIFNAIFHCVIIFPHISSGNHMRPGSHMTPCSLIKKEEIKTVLNRKIEYSFESDFVLCSLQTAFLHFLEKRSRFSTPVNKCFLIVKLSKASF